MDTFISHSSEETQALGESWGRVAKPGLVLGLSGDLGAGKTELVKGIAKGLGVTERVQSPTFALVNTYSGGRLPLHHLDLYRLETLEQILGAGLEEYLHSDGVTVIEWIERWFAQDAVRMHAGGNPQKAAFPGMIFVRIEEIAPTERRITYETAGA